MKKRQMKKNEKKAALKEQPKKEPLTTEQELNKAVQELYSDCYFRATSEKEKKFILSEMRDATYGIKVIDANKADELQHQLKHGASRAVFELSQIGGQTRIEKNAHNFFRCFLILASLASSFAAAYQDDMSRQRNFHALTAAAFIGACYSHQKYRKNPPYPPMPNAPTR